MKTEKLAEGLYRILLPFDGSVTTTVYAAVCGDGIVLIDAGTYPADAAEHILPSLRALGLTADKVSHLLLTHDHSHHVGGVAGLLACLPALAVRAPFPMDVPRFSLLTDGEVVGGRLQAVFLPGHTDHSLGFLDLKTKTLLSGDCLQLGGVGKYRSGIYSISSYRASVARLKEMKISRIVAAHEYEPLGSLAEGGEQVRAYLDACLAYS